ncbi:MAG: DUF4013 domain-containing protein [Sorangiineae bacterium]|nr:DUF4013 domain-containing protein [Sorangiineae bacterium]MEB2343329.1 DUF4013 domain-containing protein [Deltaproteobacteria bacterium]
MLKSPLGPPPAQVSALDAMRFAFSDRDWLHSVLVGTVISLIPMAGPIVLMGWQSEILQRLVREHPRPIPKLEFSDLSHYLGRGVVPFAVQLIAALPLGIVITMAAFMLSVGANVIMRGGLDPAIVIGVSALFVLIAAVGGAAVTVAVNGALTAAELNGDFSGSLAPSALLRYGRATWATVLVSYFVFSLLVLLVLMGSALVFCVGLYAGAVVVRLGQVHLRWQIYRRYRSLGGEALPLAAAADLPSEVQPRYGIG